MKQFVPEMLQEINDHPALVTDYKNDASINMIFNAAYRPENKFLLPEGDPPYREDAAPIGMSPAVLKQELRKLYVFCRADLKPIKREGLFIELLESIHPSEAKVLLAIKNQDLTTLYPKLTHKFVFDSGFIANPPPEKPKKAPRAKKSTGAVA